MTLPFSQSATMQSAAAATGNGTAITVKDMATLGLQVTGTFVATVTFEATLDDTNWVSLQVANVATGAVSTTTTVPGVFTCQVAGLAKVRARISAYTSGAITVTSFATSAGGGTIADANAYTTPTHTAVNVTTGSGEVLASNANRLYALLVNDSDTTIYIKLGAAAVVNEGIRLNALGGNYEMSAMLGNLYTGAINGIHGGTGNKVLLMTEGV